MNDEPKEMAIMPDSNCINIATISAGFEKGDFLVREEQGNRVYFDFFEEVSLSAVCISVRRWWVKIWWLGSVFWLTLSVILVALLVRHSITFPTRDIPAWQERMRSIGLT